MALIISFHYWFQVLQDSSPPTLYHIGSCNHHIWDVYTCSICDWKAAIFYWSDPGKFLSRVLSSMHHPWDHSQTLFILQGFETRGTTISQRITAWQNMAEATRPSGSLTSNPKELLAQPMHLPLSDFVVNGSTRPPLDLFNAQRNVRWPLHLVKLILF